jgi:hypothetical protein
MDYIQPDDDTVLYLRCSGGNHKLYAPSTFEPYRSLYFLDDEESIMHYELPLSDKRLQIDDITLSVMEEIGWLTRQSQSSGVEIKGDGLADNGIASAYETHRFSLTDATGITGANWKFILPLADGSERLIKSETGVMEFTIPAISDESLYSVNVNGDIYGTVKFEGDKDGVPVTAAYRVSLELKPHVSDIYLSDIYPGSDGAGYAVTCSVAYSGGQSVVVTAEQDGSVVDRRMVDEPYLAHLSFEGLSPLYATVITAKVSNARGAAEKSVTIPAANGGSRKAASVEPAAGGIDGGSVIEVYGTDGLKLGELDGEDGLVGLSRGAYILRYRDGQNTTATKKYMKL